MRFLKLLMLILLILTIAWTGCDLTNTGSANGFFQYKVELTDTNKVQTKEFQTGEYFDISLMIINNSKQPQNYSHDNPKMKFEIVNNDSTFASSEYACVYTAERFYGTLQPGDTLRAHWRAPVQGCTLELVQLVTGEYTVHANPLVLFDDYGQMYPIRINFKINRDIQ